MPTSLAEIYPSETKAQQMLVRWWAMVCASHGLETHDLMAFPLAGARTKQNGARMKAEGCRSGTLDMQLAVMRGGYGALWIENKTIVGKLSPEQKATVARLERRGYCVCVCKCFEDGIKAIETYLSYGKPPTLT